MITSTEKAEAYDKIFDVMWIADEETNNAPYAALDEIAYMIRPLIKGLDEDVKIEVDAGFLEDMLDICEDVL